LQPATQFADADRRLIEDRWKARFKGWLAPFTLLACGIFLYLQVFVLPATPHVAIGDQAIYLHHAVRMLEGEMIYRDYDHFTLPGTDVVYMTLFKLFGVRAWIPQAMLMVLGTSMLALVSFISRRLIIGMSYLLPGLLFVALPFSSYLDATHHWYSTVATTAALAVVLEDRSFSRLLGAGFFLGLATFFTQSAGLLAVGFAFFLLWERRREGQTWDLLLKKEAALLFSYVATTTACVAYFVWAVGLKKVLYYTVVFVVKYYPADSFNTWRGYLMGRPQLHVWTTWLDIPAFTLVHLIVPFVYIAFLVVGAHRSTAQSGKTWNRLMLVNVTGLSLFLTVASAPVYNRLYAVSAPALILLVWLLESSPRLDRAPLRLFWLMLFLVVIARPLVTQMRWTRYLDLPTGHTAFFESAPYEKCKWMLERTRVSDYFFGDHLISFTLRLRNAGRVPFLRPTDYTRPEEVADAIQGLERFKVQFVSWYSGLDRGREEYREPGNHLAPIRLYLREHYHLAQTFSNGDQIWERNQ
jgi:hypothetical protein